MKFVSKFLPLFLVLTLILVAACSPEATSNNSSDASAQTDGGSGDGSIVGSDAGETNDSANNDVTSTDKVDNDTTTSQTDVSSDSDVATGDETDATKPFCPEPGDPAEATLEIKLADGPQCFIPDSDEATMVLSFVNAKVGIGNHPLANLMPADPAKPDGTGGCSLQTIHNTDYCFPIAKVFGKEYKPKWAELLTENAGKNSLVVKYPDSSTFPDSALELIIQSCSAGMCKLGSSYSDGSYSQATYDITKKTLTISWYPEKIFSYTDAYKLE